MIGLLDLQHTVQDSMASAGCIMQDSVYLLWAAKNIQMDDPLLKYIVQELLQSVYATEAGACHLGLHCCLQAHLCRRMDICLKCVTAKEPDKPISLMLLEVLPHCDLHTLQSCTFNSKHCTPTALQQLFSSMH